MIDRTCACWDRDRKGQQKALSRNRYNHYSDDGGAGDAMKYLLVLKALVVQSPEVVQRHVLYTLD